MQVLLFNPPAPDGSGMTREGRCTQRSSFWGTQWPPVTLATAAALLEAEGHRVIVRDFPAMREGGDMLADIVCRHEPDMAFWATGSPVIGDDLSWGAIIKKYSPRTMTGVFGTHVTALPEDALKISGIDCVIRREPEKIIRSLCRPSWEKREDVAGISFCSNSGEIVHNPDGTMLAAEEIPPPSWHLLPALPYTLPLKRRPFLIVAPVRGCPYPCTFCTASIYYGRRLRRRPVESVLNEIEQNIKRYNVHDFFIWADTFTADHEYVRAFCRGIRKRGCTIMWTCNSRVDTVDRDLLREMKDAGLWMISFGLESGSERVLERSRKGITISQSRLAVQAAHDVGVRTAGHFIFGLPGETPETMAKTTDFALSLPLDIAQFYAAAPFPGTDFFSEAVRNKWLTALCPTSQETAAVQLPGLPAAAVNRARQKAYFRFYSRPRTFCRLISLCASRA